MKAANNTKAIVMLSGGLDSAVALYWAKRKGWKIQGLSFTYFKRSHREMVAAERTSKRASCEFRIFQIPFLKEIEDLKIKSRNNYLKKAPGAYIPSRNSIFYGIASSIAEVSNSRYIVAGHNADDAKSFPDSSERFFEAFNEVSAIGTYSHGRTGKVIMPLGKLSKTGVIKLGEDLGVPFELTWSCYFSRTRPCGKCNSCLLRATGFREAGLKDPLISN